MGLCLATELSPARLPLDAICELALRITLTNDGGAPIRIYPKAAQLSALSSFAGIGFSWGITLLDPAGQKLPLQELRTWYGPPGNPPAPTWAKQYAVDLAAGDREEVALPLCWIPNSQLTADNLDPQALDPEGMDNIRAPGRSPQLPPLAERIVLAQSSVIVFAPRAPLEEARQKKTDFLRGRVVAFVPSPGEHRLVVQYWQTPFMGLGETMNASAPPLAITIGA